MFPHSAVPIVTLTMLLAFTTISITALSST
jgi:hypothetical protein